MPERFILAVHGKLPTDGFRLLSDHVRDWLVDGGLLILDEGVTLYREVNGKFEPVFEPAPRKA